MKICALPVLAVIQLVLLTGSAFAGDIQIVAMADQADEPGNVVVLNDSDAAGPFDFSGGVGSGPDLSGNGSMVQVVQPIQATNNPTTSNGQITYRYVPSTASGSSSSH